jgi:hypothetical protein
MSGSRGHALLVAAVAGASVISSGCALRQASARTDVGIPVCPDGAEKDLLSSAALQCWFSAAHGRWRTLNHQSHLEALVVEIEAGDVRDAVEIAQRVVADPMASAYSEILVYVARQHGSESRIRRVRWTPDVAFETLDFSSPAADAPLTVRSSPGSTPHPKP